MKPILKWPPVRPHRKASQAPDRLQCNMSFLVLLLVPLCVLGHPVAQEATPEATLHDDDLYALPSGFLLGAGLSAFQTEGAWNEDGKGESALEHIMHKYPQAFVNNTDVAADHYHRYKEDLALAGQMKLKAHRFSISWERVLPTGDAKNPNPQGVKFYHDYIAEVRKNGMEPIPTILFFTFPYTVQLETGGWGTEAMDDKYVEYADFLFSEYGTEVKYWVTFNEPNMFCSYFITNTGSSGDVYGCIHHMILAHTRAYRLYKSKYDHVGGQVGFSALQMLAVPTSTKYLDRMAAEAFNMIFSGYSLYVLTYGDYPPLVRYLVDSRSEKDGLPQSRLPYFTAEEKESLKGASDFFGLNVYSTYTVSYKDPSDGPDHNSLLGPILDDIPFVHLENGMNFGEIDTYTMEYTLQWAWYNFHVPIIITENGYGDTKGLGIHDHDRAAYLSANLRGMLRAMKQNGVQVIGHCTWSLIDAFEWSAGYTKRPFGLIQVDYETGSLNRTLKDSSKFFIEIAETGRVPEVLPSVVTSTPVVPTSVTSTIRPPPSSTPSKAGAGATTKPAAILVLLWLALTAHFVSD